MGARAMPMTVTRIPTTTDPFITMDMSQDLPKDTSDTPRAERRVCRTTFTDLDRSTATFRGHLWTTATARTRWTRTRSSPTRERRNFRQKPCWPRASLSAGQCHRPWNSRRPGQQSPPAAAGSSARDRCRSGSRSSSRGQAKAEEEGCEAITETLKLIRKMRSNRRLFLL